MITPNDIATARQSIDGHHVVLAVSAPVARTLRRLHAPGPDTGCLLRWDEARRTVTGVALPYGALKTVRRAASAPTCGLDKAQRTEALTALDAALAERAAHIEVTAARVAYHRAHGVWPDETPRGQAELF